MRRSRKRSARVYHMFIREVSAPYDIHAKSIVEARKKAKKKAATLITRVVKAD